MAHKWYPDGKKPSRDIDLVEIEKRLKYIKSQVNQALKDLEKLNKERVQLYGVKER